MRKGFKVLLSIVVLLFLAFLILISAGSRIFTDWLWFKHLGFLHTFLVMFLTNFWIRIAVGLAFTIVIFINLLLTRKTFLNYLSIQKDEDVESIFANGNEGFFHWLNKKRLTWMYLLGSIVLGFLFSSIGQDIWKMVLKFLNKTSFGTTDPIFGRDIGFYVFSLPFFNFLKEMGMVVVILTLIIVGFIYILTSGINSFNELGLKLSNRAKGHMTILVAIFLFLKAWDYRLSMYNLLYSSRGVAFGAGYTDVNANLLGLRILFVIAVVIGVILLGSLIKKNYRILIWGLGIWLLTSLIFGGIYPGFVQRFQVEPNEINRESKYINYNIDMTLKAYGLDDITTKDFEVKNDLDGAALRENEETINNIRLWDSRPLLSTYGQLQELRQYYSFIDVDVDRYNIEGKYRQVMLSAREMNQDLLSGQAQTWINKTLKYTHGFGVAMSPVNRITSEGLPEFFIKDIPPQTTVDISLENSSIYYGEKTDEYVIANSNSSEFHYPRGDENVYINYDGEGGVKLDSFLKKVVYAIRFGSIKFLLADDISPDSRMMYYRNIKNRVRRAAPFLEYDQDPYLVVSEGKLFWIQDAYTTTDRYPYSQPTANMGNYIRNSVKIVIDAYNGSLKFYIMDESDPIIQTYKKIFPDLFVSGEEMSDDLRRHIRYPEDLFKIQSSLYSTYHMKDPQVFYNKEDLWNIPSETYAGGSIQMEPYYIINKLPGEDKSEFILMMPFTPDRKNNMIAWMAARSDGDRYGELLVYNFPKDTLVYGPKQIESRIDQDSEISQLLTLWSQRGSRVIRGNLLVIPVENSILYVEPIYIQAETSELPELKRVVVAFGNQVVMTPTLGQALVQIFGEAPPETITGEAPAPSEAPSEVPSKIEEGVVIPGNIRELTQEAVDIYEQAQESLKEGDWSQYGELLAELEDKLQQLQGIGQQ